MGSKPRAVDRRKRRFAPNGVGGKQTLADGDQTLADGDQTLADGDQTLADGDQTLADSDQTNAERDQASADRDQVASERDQAASDQDLAYGVDPVLHDVTRDMRRRGARQRVLTETARLESAHERDATALARDAAALARDQAAAARDLAMAQRETDEQSTVGEGSITGGEVLMRAAEQRRRAADYRVQAAEHRLMAAQDRQAAARDRRQAAADRRQARADRAALARALATSESDPLTGARGRAAGLRELDHELDRCRRTGSLLVVAYVDVVGLKSLNDTEGHDAGDRMLQRMVAQITQHLRSYDLIIRLGGDEFLCSMSNVTLSGAHQRFDAIVSAITASRETDKIRSGFAELTPGETAGELISRADRQLIRSHRD